MMTKFLRTIVVMLLVVWPVIAHAADIKGTQDYPLLKRFNGSEIIGFQFVPFTNFNLSLGNTLQQNQFEKNQSLEGSLLRMVYRVPVGHNAQEVFDYYKKTLSDGKFQTLYESPTVLSGKSFELALCNQNGENFDVPFGGGDTNQHYLAAKITGANNKEIYVNLLIGEINNDEKWDYPWRPTDYNDYNKVAEKKGEVMVILNLVEPKSLDYKMIPIAANGSQSTPKDIQESHDYPLIKRFEGSEIIGFKNIPFDSYNLALNSTLRGKAFESSQTLEGNVTRIVYRIPGGHSSLEILRNYQQALSEANFQTLYASTQVFSGRSFVDALCNQNGENFDVPIGSNDNNERYMSAKLSGANGKDIYVSLLVGQISSDETWNGPWRPTSVTNTPNILEHRGDVIAILDVIEPKKLDYKMISTPSQPSIK